MPPSSEARQARPTQRAGGRDQAASRAAEAGGLLVINVTDISIPSGASEFDANVPVVPHWGGARTICYVGSRYEP